MKIKTKKGRELIFNLIDISLDRQIENLEKRTSKGIESTGRADKEFGRADKEFEIIIEALINIRDYNLFRPEPLIMPQSIQLVNHRIEALECAKTQIENDTTNEVDYKPLIKNIKNDLKALRRILPDSAEL